MNELNLDEENRNMSAQFLVLTISFWLEAVTWDL